MFGLLTRLLGGAITPLTDQLSDFGARLLKKLALFAAAGLCLAVVVIALTIAFDLWIASLAGPIIGALAVAGLYLAAGLAAILAALRKPRTRATAGAEAETESTRADADRSDQVDQFTAPLIAILQRLGLRREQLAVLAGASVAKQLGPLPLVGLAILAGFLFGRLATSWRHVLPLDLVGDLLASAGLSGFAGQTPANAEDEA